MFGNIKIVLIFVPGFDNEPDGPGRFPVKDKAMKTNVSFDKLVYMGVKMVLDGTPVGMAVAVLSQTNELSVAEAVQLKAAIIDQLR